MRERLIELMKEADEHSIRKCITDYDEAIADNADFLLDHGVFVVPHMVDSPIWTREPFADGEMKQGYITAVTFGNRKEGIWSYWASFAGLPVSYEFIEDDIGKTVFLTREDAEAALSTIKEPAHV